jgi:hypothetical protein
MVLAKLDRVFASTDWEAAFPLVRVRGLPKCTSDHTPLLVDTGDNCVLGKKKFRFEKWWLEREDFKDVVRKAWTVECSSRCPMEVWPVKVRYFRRLVRGWAANVIADLNKQKQYVAAKFNWLDLEAEHRELEEFEKSRMKELARELDRF